MKLIDWAPDNTPDDLSNRIDELVDVYEANPDAFPASADAIAELEAIATALDKESGESSAAWTAWHDSTLQKAEVRARTEPLARLARRAAIREHGRKSPKTQRLQFRALGAAEAEESGEESA